MKNMRILFDTNVIMDFIVDREPFTGDAEKVIGLCIEKDVECSIAAHSIPNLFYILKRYLNLQERRDILLKICEMFRVVGIDSRKLESSLKNEGFTDFEDCLQFECALEFEADYLLTRNTADFEHSTIPIIEPKALIDKLQQ